MHDVYSAMPWGNTIDVVTISGLILKQVLEHSVSAYKANDPDPGGRFLQVSGLILTYDVRKPIGQRLISALTGQPSIPGSWRAIQDDQLYEVAVPSFLAFGGDTFQMIPDSMVEYKNTGFLDNDLIVSYLNKNNPLQLPPAGRIIMLSEKMASNSSSLTFMLWMFLLAFL